MQVNSEKSLFALSIVLFVACLFLHGYVNAASGNPCMPREGMQGWMLLMLGWGGLFDGILTWLANPILAIAWIFLKNGKYRSSSIAAVIAILFALTFLLVKEFKVSDGGVTVASTGPAYWLWVFSMVACLAASLLATASETGEAFKPKIATA